MKKEAKSGVELIITEKPSSAKKVAEALAEGKLEKKAYKKVPYYELKHGSKEIFVVGAVGHLFSLATEKKGFDYPIFEIDWKPLHLIQKGSFVKDYINAIEMLGKKATEFTLACDFDIEGELIGWNALRFLCKQKDGNRMKFSTLTKPDLVEAYENKSPTIDWGQALAGETRHKLDWFYGINLSRALTKSVKTAGSFKIMSIGRVQGPALKLLVEKEKEIMAFVPQPYWQLQMLAEAHKQKVEAWHIKDKFFDKNEAEKIFEKVKKEKSALVKEVKKSQHEQPPPFPFDLTTLQTESYAQFGINPKETLEHAQQLYLAGLISYPRTSSQQLDPKLGFKNILTHLSKQKEFGELCEKLLKQGKLLPRNGPKTDPAHPAIYPTGTIPEELKPRTRKIYELIVRRFLATFGQPAVRESINVSLLVKEEIFVASGKRTVEPGWHVYYGPFVKYEEKELPAMKEGEKVVVEKINKLEDQTKPPKRFTPSSIIKELEKRNLGTKATRAEIVDTLSERGYVTGQQLQVTKFGLETATVLGKYSPRIMDEALTRHFEKEMEGIRHKKTTEENVLSEAKLFLIKILKKFKEQEKKIGEELLGAVRETQEIESTIGLCPVCKKGNLKILLNRKTRKKFIGCEKYPDCQTTYPLPQGVLVKPSEEKCTVCTSAMVLIIRKGKKPQTVCINPECTSKKSEESKPERVGVECPKCKEGKIVLKRGFYGEFLACDKYPKCRYTESIKK